jgi:hypothetical protein
VVRGHKVRTSQALFDEFGAALQFPDYFGENWDAWDEWMPAKQYVLVVARALEVLANERRAMVQAFADGLMRAAEAWAEPIERGEYWDRPATPFHVILQVQPGERDLPADIWGRPTSEFIE